jgi:hypothetical protein
VGILFDPRALSHIFWVTAGHTWSRHCLTCLISFTKENKQNTSSQISTIYHFIILSLDYSTILPAYQSTNLRYYHFSRFLNVSINKSLIINERLPYSFANIGGMFLRNMFFAKKEMEEKEKKGLRKNRMMTRHFFREWFCSFFLLQYSGDFWNVVYVCFIILFLFQGFTDRLTRDLSIKTPSSMRFKLIAASGPQVKSISLAESQNCYNLLFCSVTF